MAKVKRECFRCARWRGDAVMAAVIGALLMLLAIAAIMEPAG